MSACRKHRNSVLILRVTACHLISGESVLSLVIVDEIARINDGEYYLTFFLGVLNVIFLQFLYFKSQPHDVAHHAMRRSRHAGLSYNFMIQVYSAALIIVGVSYKLLLTEVSIDATSFTNISNLRTLTPSPLLKSIISSMRMMEQEL